MIPYSEDLLDQVQAQLEWVTVAAGYSVDIQSVQRADRDALNTSVKPCVHLHKIREVKDRSGSEWSVTLDLAVAVFVDSLSTDTRAQERMESEVAADVERAMCALEDDVEFRADFERVETVLFSTGDEEEVTEHGAIVYVTLGYRVDFKDPQVPS